MHSDVHHLLHHLRSADLIAEARSALPGEHRLRTQVGLFLVELGTRMARQQPPRRSVRLV
ncbi:hypothetical protein [Streptomyces sp. NBC_00083]|uniref:hypothetical protein n=1 Tax=Streptomyces sp. NBC_00083 TaxID=2975647 RepID=UPI0022529A51|nr:hypothetical protein [Streptomyces sp. NBC_00083]MCX5382169.1 hypothetical protein [Streptomyces sp. NBC_00083]